MDDKDIETTLDKVLHFLELKVKKNGDGLYFIENDSKDGSADKTKPVEFEHIRQHSFFSKKQLLQQFLKSEYLYVPTIWPWLTGGHLVYEMKTARNPFYKMSLWEAAVKADMADLDSV